MKLIDSSFKFQSQGDSLEDIYKHVEWCARTAYKSEDRITEQSYTKFCKMLEERGHWSCFEHGTVYLILSRNVQNVEFYIHNKYSRCNVIDDKAYITTNLRVLMENNLLEDLQFICKKTHNHTPRYCVKVICSRSISHEIVRHRSLSFVQSSQRYINYSLGKFGSELTFIIPQWIYDIRNYYAEKDEYKYLLDLSCPEAINILRTIDTTVNVWYNALKRDEEDYLFLTKTHGYQLVPQEARSILPNDCMTEICITGFSDDWIHFFKLRTAPDAHPDIRKIAKPIEKEFYKLC